MGIIHTILGVYVCWKVQIQPVIASYSTDGEIIYTYKAAKETEVIWRYIEVLSLHTGEPKIHSEDNIICISVVEAKRVTPRIKDIDITVCFLQEQFDNGIFLPKYDK